VRLVGVAAACIALFVVGAVPAGAATCARGAVYGWPVRPFDRAHPVRGGLNDPRGSAFHFGVDITAPDGTPVYAVAPGRVRYSSRHPTALAVRDPRACRSFAYWHVVPAVPSGSWVARHALLGRVMEAYGHVHLGELDARLGRYVDPTRPGRAGLFPYHDPTRPVIQRVSAERGGRVLDPGSLRGVVSVVVRTHDVPALASPPPWSGYRTSPATIGWRLVSARGRTVRAYRTIYEGRLKLDDRRFRTVYAPGTRYPRPNRPGLYRFWIARALDTRAYPNGRYVVRVRVADAHGNAARASLRITVRNR
jgi:hypothetical protein